VIKYEEYLANAAECERMARTVQNDTEKRTWQEMADSWMARAEVQPAKSTDRLSSLS
jgi:hypothetical protein